jgi:hypothetical protein
VLVVEVDVVESVLDEVLVLVVGVDVVGELDVTLVLVVELETL